MWLGIDFGTTNTSAAIFDGKEVKYIPLDPLSETEHNLRSVLYFDNNHNVCLGLNAVQRFLCDDTGRPVIMEEKVVGTIENTVSRQERGISDADEAITIIYDDVINDDVGIRGRLLQSIKTALRFADYEGTHIFNRFYTVEELIALILGHVKRKAEEHLQQPIERAVIGRPVTFSHDAKIDAIAQDRISRAAKLAGFDESVFVFEPIAAATFYANRTRKRETVLVFDFGGGTLDLTILRLAASGEREVLASVGVLVGGDDLDSAIMRGKVAPYFGTRSNIDVTHDGRPIPFPEHLAELLNQWQTIPMLTRPQHLEVIERAILYGDNRRAFEALETLATKNYGFALFQQIEQAKCALSNQTKANITLQMEQSRLEAELRREEFNALIADEKSLVRHGIRDVIAAAGLQHDEIDAIVATGGSSSIPAFQALLKAEIPGAALVVSDRFGSVTGGLAIHAHTLQEAVLS
jgi:hypothetical chaperone protein